jgi:elongation factor G
MPKYTTDAIRNVALVGAAGAGKTTLVEAMLLEAGVVGRMGRIEDGNTVCDSDDLEKEFRRSIDSALVHFDFAGRHVNVIDTPGSPDFVGRALSAMPAVEMVVVVIDAATGISSVTRRLMKAAEECNRPRMIVINKIDHAPDLGTVLDAVQESFGSVCRPINLPAQHGKAVVDCFRATSGTSDLGDVATFHTGIVDQVVEVDEKLMEEYLEKGEVDAARVHEAFEAALREGHLVPVCFAAGRERTGVPELLHALADLAPSPREGNPPTLEFKLNGEKQSRPLACAPEAPAVAHVFRVTADPYVGKLCVFRVYQGSIGHDKHPLVDDGNRPVRIAHVFKLQGKQSAEIDRVIAGDLGAVAKVEELAFNSVLHDEPLGDGGRVKTPAMPKAMYGLAIEGTSKGSETKLAEALQKLVGEDPTLVIDRVQATGETVMRGLGEQHLRVKLRLLKDRYGLEVATRPPKVAYKETITTKAEGHHRHKKQTGGAGQFGEVYLRVEPIPHGTEDVVNGLLFVDETFGGSIPRQYLPAVEKGVRQVMVEGAVAGYPLQDIKVAVYDGKYHPVDSKEVAFVTAGRRAFIDAVRKAKPVLLEPYVRLEINVPSEMIGGISSDLSGRRGRIQGADMLPGNIAVIKAEAPLSEVMTYASQLKSITGGSGTYTMEYSHDERTPPQVQEQVIKAYKPKDEE